MSKDKNEVKKVDQKEAEEIIKMVYEDTMEFLQTSKSSEKGAKKDGSFVAFGLLRAVFSVIFGLAPNVKVGFQIVFSVLTEFLGVFDDKIKKDGKNEK